MIRYSKPRVLKRFVKGEQSRKMTSKVKSRSVTSRKGTRGSGRK